MLTVCDFLPVRTVTVRPATLVLKLDGVMLVNEVLHLQRRAPPNNSRTLRGCAIVCGDNEHLDFPGDDVGE
jgi:hypothetical protein